MSYSGGGNYSKKSIPEQKNPGPCHSPHVKVVFPKDSPIYAFIDKCISKNKKEYTEKNLLEKYGCVLSKDSITIILKIEDDSTYQDMKSLLCCSDIIIKNNGGKKMKILKDTDKFWFIDSNGAVIMRESIAVDGTVLNLSFLSDSNIHNPDTTLVKYSDDMDYAKCIECNESLGNNGIKYRVSNAFTNFAYGKIYSNCGFACLTCSGYEKYILEPSNFTRKPILALEDEIKYSYALESQVITPSNTVIVTRKWYETFDSEEKLKSFIDDITKKHPTIKIINSTTRKVQTPYTWVAGPDSRGNNDNSFTTYFDLEWTAEVEQTTPAFFPSISITVDEGGIVGMDDSGQSLNTSAVSVNMKITYEGVVYNVKEITYTETEN